MLKAAPHSEQERPLLFSVIERDHPFAYNCPVVCLALMTSQQWSNNLPWSQRLREQP